MSSQKSSVAPPDFIAPELATLVDKAPSGDDWIHEIDLGVGLLITKRYEGSKKPSCPSYWT